MRTINKCGVAAAVMVQVGEKIQVYLRLSARTMCMSECNVVCMETGREQQICSLKLTLSFTTSAYKISVGYIILRSQHCTDIAWFLKLHRWARRQQNITQRMLDILLYVVHIYGRDLDLS